MKSIAYDFKAERKNQFMAIICQLELYGFDTGEIELDYWNQVTIRLSIDLTDKEPDNVISIIFIYDGHFVKHVKYESIDVCTNIQEFLQVCKIWKKS